MSEIAEILLAQIWNSQWFRRSMRTVDGQDLGVVYPGVWTHGFGPDFRNAMIDLSTELRAGDVEIELEPSGWYDHGHDRNPDFDNVILQVVARDTGVPPVRRCDGGIVPRLVLTDFLKGPIDDFSEVEGLRPLGAIGFDSCAPEPARLDPDAVTGILQRAGDRRMQEKVASISGELAVSPPAQVLYARLLDALGYTRNRDPMAEIAARLPWEQLAVRIGELSPGDRFWTAASLLLGVGGFLPLSPRDAHVGRLDPEQIGTLESIWAGSGTPWHRITVAPGFWQLGRIRPVAHPVRRLLAAAWILSRAVDGLVETLAAALHSNRPRQALVGWLADENPYLGRDHAHEIVVNVLIPFALAYGDEADQRSVSDAAAGIWERLPAGRGNAVTRKTVEQICGDAPFRVGSARVEQGLIHINRSGCSQMRCFECPVAHLALNWESTNLASSTGS